MKSMARKMMILMVTKRTIIKRTIIRRRMAKITLVVAIINNYSPKWR